MAPVVGIFAGNQNPLTAGQRQNSILILEHNQRLAILKNIRSGFEIHGNEGTHNTLQFVDLGFTDTLDLTQFARCSVRQTLHCVISRVREFLDVVCGYAVVDKYFERLIAYFLRVCTLC